MGQASLLRMIFVVGLVSAGCSMTPDLGPWFERASDVGVVSEAGTTSFDPETGDYVLSGSGDNIWATSDAFHYAWCRLEGDLRLEAEVEFQGEGGNPHRKAGWMVRSGLEPDDPYVDVAVHGDGLIGMQFRRRKGAETEEYRAVSTAHALVRLERTGELFSLSVIGPDGSEEPVGALLLDLPSNPYVGLFITSHDNSRTESVRFKRLARENRVPLSDEERVTESTLETFDLESGKRQVVHRNEGLFEAPNWTRDGTEFLFNSDGKMYRLPVSGGELTQLDTGTAVRCNNDHGFSPDGKWLAVSHAPEGQSLIYVLLSEGGEPRLVTRQGPSYWHGWSPDGKTLAYCAEREGEFDIYTIPVGGGQETRLTSAPGLDDGPDYAPDGKFIYINSERSGLMKIWRISPDGKIQEQVTFDNEFADWFAHPSPDGKQFVFLSYDRSVKGHPPNREVLLRSMPMDGGNPTVLTHLFGGQGTINVPSWSPDSKRFAFVSYRKILPGW